MVWDAVVLPKSAPTMSRLVSSTTRGCSTWRQPASSMGTSAVAENRARGGTRCARYHRRRAA